MGRVIPREGMDNSEVSFNCDRYSRPDLMQNISIESQKVDQTWSKIFIKKVKYIESKSNSQDLEQKGGKYFKRKSNIQKAEYASNNSSIVLIRERFN